MDVNKEKVGSAETPSGITLYDEDTKQPYCVKVRAGQAVTEAGECGSTSLTTGGSSVPSVASPPCEATLGTETEPAAEPAPEPVPTVILNGREGSLDSSPSVQNDTILEPAPEEEPVESSEPVIDAPLTTSLFDSEEEASSTPVTEETASTTPTTNADITSPAG